MIAALSVGTRRVDWLELFFDVVFVVIIKQLAGILHGQPSPTDFLKVAGLFTVVWTVWLTVTSCVNLTISRSIDGRVPVLVAMAGVGLIAVSIPEAAGSGALMFVVGCVLARMAIWPLRMRLNDPTLRGRLRATLNGPGSAILWLATLFVPGDIRPWVWGAMALGEFAYIASDFPSIRFSISHLVERVGLFVMIVLGESLVELIQAVRTTQSALPWAVSAGAFVVVCTLWWHHYQAGTPVTERVLSNASGAVLRDVIVVGHYFIVLGLIGIAAGLGSAIENADAVALPYGAVVALAAGVGIYHVGYVVIAWRYGVPSLEIALLALVSAVAVAAILLAGLALPGWVLLLLVLVYMAADRLLSPRVARRWRPTPA